MPTSEQTLRTAAPVALALQQVCRLEAGAQGVLPQHWSKRNKFKPSGQGMTDILTSWC